jgi:hypothetical protein
VSLVVPPSAGSGVRDGDHTPTWSLSFFHRSPSAGTLRVQLLDPRDTKIGLDCARTREGVHSRSSRWRISSTGRACSRFRVATIEKSCDAAPQRTIDLRRQGAPLCSSNRANWWCSPAAKGKKLALAGEGTPLNGSVYRILIDRTVRPAGNPAPARVSPVALAVSLAASLSSGDEDAPTPLGGSQGVRGRRKPRGGIIRSHL